MPSGRWGGLRGHPAGVSAWNRHRPHVRSALAVIDNDARIDCLCLGPQRACRRHGSHAPASVADARLLRLFPIDLNNPGRAVAAPANCHDEDHSG